MPFLHSNLESWGIIQIAYAVYVSALTANQALI